MLVAICSAFVAARTVPPLVTLIGLLVSGTLVSGGALAVNSYLEVDADSKMRRTAHRPLPSGRIFPRYKAFIFGLSLIVVGLTFAFFSLNISAVLFIALGAFFYIQVYTIWLKPRTIWNIVLGGFAGSCASLAGWYAVTSNWPLVAWALAALVFVWTPSHFWSLAVLTEEDYSRAGVPMLPSVVGVVKASKAIVVNTLLLIPVSLLIYPYFRGAGSVLYLAVATGLGLLLLFTNIKLLKSPTKENAWLAFKFSSPYLAIIFVLAVIGALL